MANMSPQEDVSWTDVDDVNYICNVCKKSNTKIYLTLVHTCTIFCIQLTVGRNYGYSSQSNCLITLYIGNPLMSRGRGGTKEQEVQSASHKMIVQ